MFAKGTEKYGSDIKLGEKYRDPQTGIVGTATAVYFFQYACERVQLEFVKTDGEMKEYVFDAPRLETLTPVPKRARAERTGGPGSSVTDNASPRPSAPSR
jgi:hypothetical protein